MKRNSQLESCFLESDGDTEDEEDEDGKLTHAVTSSHTCRFQTSPPPNACSRDRGFAFRRRAEASRPPFSNLDGPEESGGGAGREGRRDGDEDRGSGSWWRCLLQ